MEEARNFIESSKKLGLSPNKETMQEKVLKENLKLKKIKRKVNPKKVFKIN